MLGPQHNAVQFLGFRHERLHANPRFIPERVWHDARFRNPVPGYATTPISYVWPEEADGQVMLDDIDPQAPLQTRHRLRRRKRLRTGLTIPRNGRAAGVGTPPWPPLTAAWSWDRRGHVLIRAPV